MSDRLRDALLAASEQMPTVKLAHDTWQQGRRRRLLARVRTWLVALASVALAAGVGAVVVRPGLLAGGPGAEAVPSQVALPWLWQGTVQMDPGQRAVVTFSGESVGLIEPDGNAVDDVHWLHNLAVVGPDGGTRMARYLGAYAGETVLLSPDGTRIAGDSPRDAHINTSGMAILDLTTGETTLVRPDREAGVWPVAWSPDGRSMLVRTNLFSSPNGAAYSSAWLDLDSLVWTQIPGTEQPQHAPRRASWGAVAPDGEHAAVTVGRSLKLADHSGHVAWEADLGERAFLAGKSAFSPDGSRITIITVDGCLESCSAEQLAARRWSFSYLDTATGQPADGPALPSVTGAKVRVLGWSQGRDLVVVRHEPATPTWSDRQDVNWYGTGSEEMGHATLLRLTPGGTTTTLLDPPDDVRAIDVPLDIVTAGRFGGPPSHAAATPVRSLDSWWEYLSVYLCCSACLLLVLAIALLLVRRWRRRTRARAERPEV